MTQDNKTTTFSVQLFGRDNKVKLSCIGTNARQAYTTYLQAFAELLTVEGMDRIETAINGEPIARYFDLILEDTYLQR